MKYTGRIEGGKGILCCLESICEYCKTEIADAICLADSLDSLEGGGACGDEILDQKDILALV